MSYFGIIPEKKKNENLFFHVTFDYVFEEVFKITSNDILFNNCASLHISLWIMSDKRWWHSQNTVPGKIQPHRISLQMHAACTFKNDFLNYDIIMFATQIKNKFHCWIVMHKHVTPITSSKWIIEDRHIIYNLLLQIYIFINIKWFYKNTKIIAEVTINVLFLSWWNIVPFPSCALIYQPIGKQNWYTVTWKKTH
jgi:hypothetical protein